MDELGLQVVAGHADKLIVLPLERWLDSEQQLLSSCRSGSALLVGTIDQAIAKMGLELQARLEGRQHLASAVHCSSMQCCIHDQRAALWGAVASISALPTMRLRKHAEPRLRERSLLQTQRLRAAVDALDRAASTSLPGPLALTPRIQQQLEQQGLEPSQPAEVSLSMLHALSLLPVHCMAEHHAGEHMCDSRGAKAFRVRTAAW